MQKLYVSQSGLLIGISPTSSVFADFQQEIRDKCFDSNKSEEQEREAEQAYESYESAHDPNLWKSFFFSFFP